jgi:hypothetical protein
MQAGAVGAVGNVSGSPAGPGSSPDCAGAYSVRPTSRNVRVDQLAGKHDLPANPP